MNKVLLFFISGVIFISAIFLFTNMEMDDLHGDLKDGSRGKMIIRNSQLKALIIKKKLVNGDGTRQSKNSRD